MIAQYQFSRVQGESLNLRIQKEEGYFVSFVS